MFVWIWLIVGGAAIAFFGRGQVQLTHEANYRKMSPIVGADLVANPAVIHRVSSFYR